MSIFDVFHQHSCFSSFQLKYFSVVQILEKELEQFIKLSKIEGFLPKTLYIKVAGCTTQFKKVKIIFFSLFFRENQ